MKRWITSTLTVALLTIAGSTWAAECPECKAAQTLIESWFSAMKSKQIDKAAGYLAPQFLSIHTDGVVRNKEQEIILMKNLDLKDYKLSDFQFSQSNNIITVTYRDQTAERIDNTLVGAKPAGRMAVLQKQGKDWVVIAYANLDTI